MRHRRPAPRRRWASLVVAIVCFTALPAPRPARAEDERIALRAELGAEYDSNVHRTEKLSVPGSPAPVGSPLGRAVLGWSAADRVGTSQDVAFSILGAAKLFTQPAARSENVGVVETGGSWRIAAGRLVHLGLGAAYYEAIQQGTHTEQQLSGDARDFRSLSPSGRLWWSIGDHGTLGFAGGYRWFVFKPNRDYDFGAPVLSAEYQMTRETADGGADWELAMGAGVEQRRFAGPRLQRQAEMCDPNTCAVFADLAGTRHRDRFFSGHLSVSRTGRVLIGAGYAVQWNDSNSYAETLIRHVGTVRFTAPLPLGVYLAARTELVYVTYVDGVAPISGSSGQAYATIDDENRSQIRAELSRDLGAHLQLIARSSLYLNPLGQLHYRRQTATLSVAFNID
jgi:hypothetical protein